MTTDYRPETTDQNNIAKPSNVFPIFTQRQFSENDVLEVLPILRRVTVKTMKQVADFQKRLQWIPKQEPLYTRVTDEAEKCLQVWVGKMKKLGMEPKGIWEVHFPTTGGAYVWKVIDGEERCGFLKDQPEPITNSNTNTVP